MRDKIQLVFDCKDPENLSKFYAEALRYKLQDPPEGFASWQDALKQWGVPEQEWNESSAIVDPDGKGPRVYFQRMETPKLGKNRVHIDFNASSAKNSAERKAQVRAEADRIEKLGAKRQKEWDEGDNGFWIVMLDPEGNEFCIQ